MALARVKSPNPGDTILAADYNAEFNNILNNPTSLINLTAAGDLCIVSSASAVTRLAIGTAGQYLITSTGLLPTWVGPGVSGYQVINLVGQNDAVTPNTQYGYSANLVALRNTNDTSIVIRTSTGTITNNILTAGSAANGRDQAAAFAASTWIYFYFIWNGTTLATLSSTVAPPTGPTLPTGYTHWALAGAVFYNATPLLVRTRMAGAWMIYETPQSLLASGSATVETTVSSVNFLPSITMLSFIHANANGVANQTVAARDVASLRILTGTDFFTIPVASPASGPNIDNDVVVILPNIASNIFYLWTRNSSGGTAPRLTLDVSAYLVPNGSG